MISSRYPTRGGCDSADLEIVTEIEKQVDRINQLCDTTKSGIKADIKIACPYTLNVNTGHKTSSTTSVILTLRKVLLNSVVNMKICLTCADGGHLTEMMQILDAFEGHELFFITYEGIRASQIKNEYKVYTIPNIIGHTLGFILSYPKLLYILLKERPKLVVSTGSEIAIPVFYFAWLLRMEKIYIETLTRINNPSMTAKIVYPVSDIVLVQWEPLAEKIGKKARYWGSIL